MSAQTNIDLQNRVYRNFSSGQTDEVLKDAAPDIVVEMIQVVR